MEVNMLRAVLSTTAAAALVLGLTGTAAAQSKAARIASAMAAAPASIGKNATIKDWPDKSGTMATLREGSNGWMCLPSHPKTRLLTNDAMCMDGNFGDLIGALISNKPPALKGVGYSYMLSADDWESNTDPVAQKETADNQWHHVRPHVMVVYPDKAMLAGIPTRPSMNGPYVMWSSTPYAHVMWPVK
jgi:hypothetical protein